jgi:uncharacterized protein
MNIVTDSMPWYRQPLVWMLIILPATVVVASFITLYLAIRSDDGLVEDDYYQRGKEINRVLDRDHAALRYGLQGRALLDTAHGAVHVQLSSNAPIAPARMNLKLLYATRAGLDHTITLTRDADGAYQAALPTLAQGHWYLQLSADDWRLNGEMHMPADSVAVLAPTR